MQLSTIAELRGNIREAYQLVEYGQLPAAVEVLGRAIEVLRKSDSRWNIHNKKSNLLLEVFVWIGDLYIFDLKSITKYSWLYVLSALTFFTLFRMCIYVSHLFWGFYCIMIWADWEIHLHVHCIYFRWILMIWFEYDQICPWDPSLHETRAECYIQMGEYYKAISDIRPTTSLRSDNRPAFLKMSHLYYKLGDAEESLK